MSPSEALSVIVPEESMVWPWQAEPYRLWSLLEMEKFQAELIALFAASMGGTHENTRICGRLPRIATALASEVARQVSENICKRVAEETNGRVNLVLQPQDVDLRDIVTDGITSYVRDENKQAFDTAHKVAAKLRLPTRWESKVKRLIESVDTSDTKTLEVLANELIHDLCAELKEPLFLYIPPSRRDYFEQNEPPFGQPVADKFPDSPRDIAAATRCLALDEWTACVFHLMRVLEHGLRPLAARFNVSFTVDSWHKVIKGIEDGIAALRNKSGLTDADRAELSELSEAASQFRYFKDAWRNHVSHSRATYDEREAELIWTHVRDFMQQMAR